MVPDGHFRRYWRGTNNPNTKIQTNLVPLNPLCPSPAPASQTPARKILNKKTMLALRQPLISLFGCSCTKYKGSVSNEITYYSQLGAVKKLFLMGLKCIAPSYSRNCITPVRRACSVNRRQVRDSARFASASPKMLPCFPLFSPPCLG